MKILIVSDTHRSNDNLKKVIKKVGSVAMVIHCGDTEGTEHETVELVGCPVKIVAGNNDFFCDLPRELEFMIGKYKVWLTHGHNYMVSMGNTVIKREARMRDVDIVLYGHTHKPVVEIDNNLFAVNPGSLTYPRQDGGRPSYCIMEIDRKEKVHFTICYL